MRLTMKGRRGILLKMIAHAGAIDYQAIRIYYSGYPKSYQNKDLYYLTTHGYISKENQRVSRSHTIMQEMEHTGLIRRTVRFLDRSV